MWPPRGLPGPKMGPKIGSPRVPEACQQGFHEKSAILRNIARRLGESTIFEVRGVLKSRVFWGLARPKNSFAKALCQNCKKRTRKRLRGAARGTLGVRAGPPCATSERAKPWKTSAAGVFTPLFTRDSRRA